MGTVITVTSGKGGTGKTTVTGGVASCLARLGRRVLCIDMDIGLRNLDISLGLSDRALMDFADVALGNCPLDRAAVGHPDLPGLFLLTAPMRLPPQVTASRIRALRDAQRTVEELFFLRQVHLVMNRIQPKLLRELRTTIDDAMDAAGLPLIGVIPEDRRVILSANLGRPLILEGRRGAANACLNIAKRIEGYRVPIMRIR